MGYPQAAGMACTGRKTGYGRSSANPEGGNCVASHRQGYLLTTDAAAVVVAKANELYQFYESQHPNPISNTNVNYSTRSANNRFKRLHVGGGVGSTVIALGRDAVISGLQFAAQDVNGVDGIAAYAVSVSVDGVNWKLRQHIWPFQTGYSTMVETKVDANGGAEDFALVIESGGIMESDQMLTFFNFSARTM